MENVFEGHAPGLRIRRLLLGTWLVVSMAGVAAAQKKTLTWDEAKRELDAVNPTLRAARIGIQQSRADEITAFLRPNPDLTISVDQVSPLYEADGGPFRPFSDSLPFLSSSYLIERRHKRELRRDSARQGTEIAISEFDDQKRNLLFDLRGAFIDVLQQKAVVEVTHESLAYYDRMLSVGRERYKNGDIAQVDLDRLELQRVQFETDVQTALVNLRTAKIRLEALLNDRTPLEQLDVSGRFDFSEIVTPLPEFRQAALDSRADLRAAVQSVDKARTDYRLAIANGSTDPTVGFDVARQYPLRAYFGVGVTIPLRIFDRNQGEKARTRLDIQRSERLVEANRLQVFSDVDSAYATLESNLTLLRPYKTRYLQQAARVRETISFSYQHGGASLLDFLQAQQDYRNIQLSYLNLVGSYLSAANQMNFAVGREVIP
uniref:Outer membrane efflux protein n=1 Tax=Solibacter usitatus (strain Ellin6076) TaxID=234267 RepID=Q01WW9_SOLUE